MFHTVDFNSPIQGLRNNIQNVRQYDNYGPKNLARVVKLYMFMSFAQGDNVIIIASSLFEKVKWPEQNAVVVKLQFL